MSHFTVLVIGPDPEKQLAPYHEFECTGVDDEYVIDVDITDDVHEQIASAEAKGMSSEEALRDGLEYYGLEAVFDGDEREHKYGYAVIKDGKLVKAFEHTNPNKKWDWYVLGGRWTGFFRLKAGRAGVTGQPGLMTDQNTDPTRCDSAFKGAIDFDGMRDEAASRARTTYERFHATIAGLPFPQPFMVTLTQCDGDLDKAREIHWNQPAMKVLTKSFFGDPQKYAVGIDDFVQAARAAATSTFAVVKDGTWYERGQMGWWGSVSDEISDEEWDAKVAQLLDSVADDTLLCVYDCHI